MSIYVERRREPRIRTNERVRVTQLTGSENAVFDARIIELSGRGLRVSVPYPLMVGSAIKIERPGELWLGEVVYCRASGDSFQAGVEIDQAFRDSVYVERLRTAMAESDQPAIAVRQP
jgi:hypothetical protein